MSTTIFIKLKPVMETEKQLCYQLAQLNMTPQDETYDSKREKIEKGIAKCRDTISVMEVKLKKVLDRVKKDQSSQRKQREQPKKDQLANFMLSRSMVEESKDLGNHSAADISSGSIHANGGGGTESKKKKVKELDFSQITGVSDSSMHVAPA